LGSVPAPLYSNHITAGRRGCNALDHPMHLAA
jgi:hypothetical protein